MAHDETSMKDQKQKSITDTPQRQYPGVRGSAHQAEEFISDDAPENFEAAHNLGKRMTPSTAPGQAMPRNSNSKN